MRIIGDVHGKISEYQKLISNLDKSIQIGDFGFMSEHKYHKAHISPNHKILLGNHDDPSSLGMEHVLGDFGMYLDYFYIRGAYSIDKMYRKEGRDWWAEEEIKSYSRQLECFDEYTKLRPNIVLSHDCPTEVVETLFKYPDFFGSTTNRLLQGLFESHQPELWIFGHHHKSITQVINGTKFICLNELETYEHI